jgi:hypothetical protein
MADRTSAALFAEIFEVIANDITDPKRQQELAEEFWEKIGHYDFDFYQMYCDDALIKLGLARYVTIDGEENNVSYFGDEHWE